jgi:hypothetical protein
VNKSPLVAARAFVPNLPTLAEPACPPHVIARQAAPALHLRWLSTALPLPHEQQQEEIRQCNT